MVEYKLLINKIRRGGEIGRRTGLKIPGPAMDVPVRVRPSAFRISDLRINC
jgi:hypothetical protein